MVEKKQCGESLKLTLVRQFRWDTGLSNIPGVGIVRIKKMFNILGSLFGNRSDKNKTNKSGVDSDVNITGSENVHVQNTVDNSTSSVHAPIFINEVVMNLPEGTDISSLVVALNSKGHEVKFSSSASDESNDQNAVDSIDKDSTDSFKSDAYDSTESSTDSDVFIAINGRFVSEKEILYILKNYCHHVPFLPFDYERNELSQDHDAYTKRDLHGSMTGVRYRGRNITVCTNRQVNDEETGNRMHDVGLMSSGTAGIDFHSATKYLGWATVEEEKENVCVFDFTRYAIDYPDAFNDGFFPVNDDNCVTASDKVGVYVAFGYPDEEQEYVSKSKNRTELRSIVRSVGGMFNEEHHDLVEGEIENISKLDFDPNGMQGGPVFAVVVEDERLVLKFAGIINKVDSHVDGKITFIRFDTIKEFLDIIVDMPDDMKSHNSD